MLSLKLLNKKTIAFMLLCLLVSLLCMRLGFWQLDRAAQKEAIQKNILASEQDEYHAVGNISDLEVKEQNFLRVKLQGEFVYPYTLLLDNRIKKGQVGFEVVSLFSDKFSRKTIWVNRGWIKGSTNRESLSSQLSTKYLSVFEKDIVLEGVIKKPQVSRWMPDVNGRLDEWPKVVVNLRNSELNQQISDKIDRPIEPFVFYGSRIQTKHLNETSTSNIYFDVNWNFVVMPPEKHMGYAVQWFLLSLTLFLLSGHLFYKHIRT